MGVDKMISQKLFGISRYYSEQEKSPEEITSFCNQYDVIFSNFISELQNEVDEFTFGILDEIFMICDSYEPNAEIRKVENYCIDELELQKKVRLALKKLRNQ